MAMHVVLTAMNAEPGDASGLPELDHFLLCELGEHDERTGKPGQTGQSEPTEHAAQLWAAEMPAARDLWMFWTDTGTHHKFRFAELAPCPAVIHRLTVGEREACVLFDRHPAAHSWDVTDPLADLMAERVRQEVRRDRGPDDPGGDQDDPGGGPDEPDGGPDGPGGGPDDSGGRVGAG
ncbi:hypothetical protein [Streptomyces sp. cmx-18-6]|uniref:hypothetical protein n=1 Tax=Streptomyces sp. cmx-18-6 TaxID=2790930 RepID=UPI00397F007F